MREWLGSAEGFARTGVAFGVYFFLAWLQKEYHYQPPYLIDEGIALAAALVVAAVVSTRVWRRPRLHVSWSIKERVIANNAVEFRLNDKSKRRLVTHSVNISAGSVLASVVLRCLAKHGAQLSLSTIDGAFYFRDDVTVGQLRYVRRGNGFSHDLPPHGNGPASTSLRVEWQIRAGLPIRCPLEYSIVGANKRAKVAAWLMCISSDVRTVEIVY